jgi:hypothetical protein
MRVPAALISWTMAQQAFNSCMILLLDALERSSITPGALKAEKAYVVFQDLQNVHTLAGLAVERISWGLKRLHDLTQLPSTGQPGSRESQGNDAEMQGPWNEAANGSHTMYEDTVMNTTGMFLLEDPGLQGFVAEAFAPIAWNLGGVEPPVPFQLKHERQISQGIGLMESPGSEDDTDDVRSVGVTQGMRRSTTMRSAPTRYATPALDDRQPPPSVTASTLHANSSRPTQLHQESQTDFPEDPHRLGHAPHLQPAGLCDETNNEWAFPAVANAVDKRSLLYAGGFPGVHRDSAVQMRHNSCPTLHRPVPAPPLQRPTYSSPAASRTQPPTTKSRPLPVPPGVSDQASFQEFLEAVPQPSSSETNSNGPVTWPVKTAGRSAPFQTQDSALNCVLPFHADQAPPNLLQEMSHEQLTASEYPLHFSEATLMSTPLGTEHMSLDEWRRWIGTSAGA